MTNQSQAAKIFQYPAKNLVTVIPFILILGFVVGFFIDTSSLGKYILALTILMIYPTMVGFQLKEVLSFSHSKVLVLTIVINFLLIPLFAWVLGTGLLASYPELFAGLAISALLPTSGMTITWTMLNKGNVPAAIKITVFGLLIGSFLTPWYLLLMVGKYVSIDILKTFQTISLIVLLPLVLGLITQYIMNKQYNKEQITKIKTYFPSLSVWSMMFLIFISISMRADKIISEPSLLLLGIGVLLIFYIVNFLFSTLVGRIFLKREDAFALVYGTVMRNLSLGLGLAITTFGPQAALLVTLAFIIQVQGAAWYGKMAQRYEFFGVKKGEVK